MATVVSCRFIIFFYQKIIFLNESEFPPIGVKYSELFGVKIFIYNVIKTELEIGIK